MEFTSHVREKALRKRVMTMKVMFEMPTMPGRAGSPPDTWLVLVVDQSLLHVNGIMPHVFVASLIKLFRSNFITLFCHAAL